MSGARGGDPSVVLAARARQLARPTDAQAGHRAETMLVFGRAGESHALPLTAVHEVVTVGSLTRLPAKLAPVIGLTAVRGRVAAVIDLAQILGRSAPDPVVHRSPGLAMWGTSSAVVVAVDDVRGVEELDTAALHATERGTATGSRHPVRGVTAAGVSVLDADALVDAIEHAIHPNDNEPQRGVS